ncbi:MAG TPA: DUF2207 domain-containing protein [Candidatus Saccharimonadales bacterium]|nr:DUF2207 domain-containing protein [Candidatus Saccharimonadales bacterium]
MKKFYTLILFALFLIPNSTVFAQESWQIDTFKSDVVINQDGTVSVKETINVDFSGVEKHGIYRDLVYKKSSTDNKKHYISYTIKKISLDSGNVSYSKSYQDNFFRIKIGDPNKTITGQHSYEIDYTAIGALNSFSDHDELYWNVTGNYWTVPINQASANLKASDGSLQKITCYEGPSGSQENCTSSLEGSTATFTSAQTLQSGEGLTLVAGLKKGSVPVIEGKAPPLVDSIDAEIFLGIFVPVFALMFFLWWKKGRDHWFKSAFLNDPNAKDEVKPVGGHDTIVVEFDPPEKLLPGEMGMILNEDFKSSAMSATIINLAVRGYLKISEKEAGLFKTKDYDFIKQDKPWNDLKDFEAKLIGGIFEKNDVVSVTSLKKSFYQDVKSAKDSLSTQMVEQKLFRNNPTKTRATYTSLGVIVIVVAVFSIGHFQVSHGLAILFGVIAAGASLVWFGYNMSARTAQGHELKRRIQGYKLFISKAEKYRQQFFERKNMFNEILPYAILFGQTEKFTKAFESLGVEPPQPNWYVGAAAFNASNFSSSMNSFASSFSSSMSSSSGFSGGGAGGGGGGGGGGGW